MASRAGLKKVTKTVRGKKGAVKRSYWVKAKDAAKGVGGFLNRHKGKILGAAALAGTAYLAHKRLQIDRRYEASKQKTHEEVQKAREAIGQAGQARQQFDKNEKDLRRLRHESRWAKSEGRRLEAATRRVERGDMEGASNIMNREAHKNLRKKRNTKLN